MTNSLDALQQALAYHRAGHLSQAEPMYRRILEVDPTEADAWHLLGMVLHQSGRFDLAAEYIARAIWLNPQAAPFHNNLGLVQRSLNQLDLACLSYRRALELKPNYPEALNNLGLVLQELGELEQAEASFRRALELQPHEASTHSNLGITLKEQGRWEQALACYRRALELDPRFADAHNNLGVAWRELGQFEQAVSCYERALELKPDYADAHMNLSRALLTLGDFPRGWAENEWRWQSSSLKRAARNFAAPLWDGTPCPQQTLLLHAEQGLGDTLHFVRYVSLVKPRCGRLVLECQRPLLSLLGRCTAIDQLVAHGEPLPAFDVHAPLLTLPKLLQTTSASIPAQVPYLWADPALTAHWRERLRQYRGFRIGINWHGRAGRGSWRFRNVPLDQFAPLARLPNVQLISLQQGAGRETLAKMRERFPLVDLGEQVDQANGPFMDTAAIMMSLDLVLTSDTAVAHLAGGLGVPVWVALPFAAEWRWLRDRTDSPWYPTMRLFRQRQREDWAGVFQDVAHALQAKGGRESFSA
jgi:Flp pilus assembly protein TadD